MRIEEIQREITRLPMGEVSELLVWLAEYHGRWWDERTQSDPAAAHFDGLLTELESEIDSSLAPRP